MTRVHENAAQPLPNSVPKARKPRARGRIVTASLVLSAMVLFGLIRWQSWQSDSLREAITLVESRKYQDALKVLTKLDRFSLSADEHRSFLLGLCQERTGRRDLAMESWKELRPGTQFFDEATLRMAEWLEDAGRLDEAEARYRGALAAEGPMSTEIRHALMQLMWMEGRLEEARPLIRSNLLANERRHGPNDTRTTAVLRAHLTLDLEVYPIEHVRKRIDAAAAKSPSDRGVALGRAYLAMRSGQSEEARAILAKLAEGSPDDARIAFARFLEGLERGDVQVIDEMRKRFDPDLPQPGIAARAASIVAESRGATDVSERILESCLEANPGEIAVIERLAASYVESGHREKAAALRARRLTLDRDRREYGNRVGIDFRTETATMADLAERLGRFFEAGAFVREMLVKTPGDPKLLDRARRLRGLDEATRVNGKLWEMADSVRPTKADPSKGSGEVPAPERSEKPPFPHFRDVAQNSGIDFVFESGRTEAKQLPETMSGGVAMLDYDADGLEDLFVVQGGSFPYDPAVAKDAPGDRLFRNLGDGKFEDVTEKTGMPPRRVGYGHGAAVGDVDNDGFPDLFVARYGSYSLYRNVEGRKFEDATAAWGLDGDRNWPSSAAFADLDNDGDLDLYVCHYVVWDAANPRRCATEVGGPPAYCVPHLLAPRPDRLYRNDGGRFVDVSSEAGITAADTEGRGLGVVAADFDDDGLVDLFVANDGTANFLFRNLGNLKFEEIGIQAGVAANSDGGYQAGMGVGFGDFDADGKFDLSVTNFYGESTSLFQNLGGSVFRERGASIGLKEATRYRLGFGTVLADLNNDGHLDMFTANGHVNDVRPVIPFEMPSQVLLGTKSGRILDATVEAGDAVEQPRLGRGAAFGDLDDDGCVDLVVTHNDEAPAFLINKKMPGDETRSIRLTLVPAAVGGKAVSPLGAVVKAELDDARTLTRFFAAGTSYLSAHDTRLTIGVGKAGSVKNLTVRWPSGRSESWAEIPLDRPVVLEEGKSPNFRDR